MTAEELEARIRRALDAGELELPLPGAGSTADRHRRLAHWGRADLSFVRIAEAHTDAVAILAAAGRSPRPGALYGVWASEAPGRRVTFEGDGTAGRLVGEKAFCTGVELCDSALVTVWAEREARPLLVEVDVADALARGTATADTSGWSTDAFAATSTGSIVFRSSPLERDAQVGPPGWYLDRPGFWHGALGPAAAWVGGAIGLVDVAERAVRRSSHARAELGALRALGWALESYLDTAGAEIDRDPTDVIAAQERALIVRHLVDRDVGSIVAHFGRAVGPVPMAFDPDVARRLAEVQLYVRQFHGADDLAEIAALERPSSGRA